MQGRSARQAPSGTNNLNRDEIRGSQKLFALSEPQRGRQVICSVETIVHFCSGEALSHQEVSAVSDSSVEPGETTAPDRHMGGFGNSPARTQLL